MVAPKCVLWEEITYHLGLGFQKGFKIWQYGSANLKDLQEISCAIHKLIREKEELEKLIKECEKE